MTFVDRIKQQWTIEKEIIRPAILDAELPAFSRPLPNCYIIFPYKIDNARAVLYSEIEMQNKFPGCWKYFRHYEIVLRSRNLSDPNKWYGYGRTQSLTKFHGEPKLVWPVLSLEPRYAYDDQDIIFTGGGNGPYYGLRPHPETNISIYYLQAILSHPVFDAMVKSIASIFRGGYRSHGKQFVKNLPIRKIDFSLNSDVVAHSNIVATVQNLIMVKEQLRTARIPQRNSLNSQSKALKQHLDGLVEDLYKIDKAVLMTIPELQDPD